MALPYSDKEAAALVEQHGGYLQAAQATGYQEWHFRRATKRWRARVTDEPVPDHAFVPSDDILPPSHIDESGVPTENLADRPSPSIRRFILTSAQNNCPVHQGFLRNLKALAKHLGAEIRTSFVLYDRQGYKGIVRRGDARLAEDRIWWDRAIEPFTCNHRIQITRSLAFCGELDILATTQNPLATMESYCGDSSVIVPHNRFRYQCVESRYGTPPKEMATTGSITLPRFIQRRVGQLAHFHHVLGALLVEVVPGNKTWFIHHLNADEDGNFYWLHRRVHNGRITMPRKVSALIMGDIHHEKLDRQVDRVTVQEIIPKLRPDIVAVHDLIDFESRNHHNISDPFFRVKHRNTQVEHELNGAARWLKTLAKHPVDIIIPRANHTDAFLRWLRETDWRTDPDNAETYLQAALQMVRDTQAGVSTKDLNPARWAILQRLKDAPAAIRNRIRFLSVDESVEVHGIEIGYHGHLGPSGSRGTPRNLSKLGFKLFTAHTHTPSIIDGCYTAGVTGKLDMGYNVGPSKWMHAHGIVYPNGKRAFVFVKDGRWRA